jgi:hypothetical protein
LFRSTKTLQGFVLLAVYGFVMSVVAHNLAVLPAVWSSVCPDDDSMRERA